MEHFGDHSPPFWFISRVVGLPEAHCYLRRSPSTDNWDLNVEYNDMLAAISFSSYNMTQYLDGTEEPVFTPLWPADQLQVKLQRAVVLPPDHTSVHFDYYLLVALNGEAWSWHPGRHDIVDSRGSGYCHSITSTDLSRRVDARIRLRQAVLDGTARFKGGDR